MPTPSSSASFSTRRVIPTLLSWPRMSTNQRWIISTPRSSQNFTISFFDFKLSIRRFPPSSLGVRRPCGRLPTQHHGHVPLRLEAEPLVELVLVLREEEKTRNRLEVRMIQIRLDELLADAAPLVRRADDHVPDRRPVRPVGDHAREADERLPVPGREHGMRVVERAAHVLGRALHRPPSGLVELEQLPDI